VEEGHLNAGFSKKILHYIGRSIKGGRMKGYLCFHGWLGKPAGACPITSKFPSGEVHELVTGTNKNPAANSRGKEGAFIETVVRTIEQITIGGIPRCLKGYMESRPDQEDWDAIVISHPQRSKAGSNPLSSSLVIQRPLLLPLGTGVLTPEELRVGYRESGEGRLRTIPKVCNPGSFIFSASRGAIKIKEGKLAQ